MTVHSHCPLCSEKPDLNAVYLFLDMDGVMIDRYTPTTADKINETIKKLFKPKENSSDLRFTELQWRTATSEHLNEYALKNLNYLIEKISKIKPVKIVLSSAWRSDGTLAEIQKNMFSKHDFSKLIIGKTPSDNFDNVNEKEHNFEAEAKEKYNLSIKDRAGQIEFWLKEHGLEKANFLIIDDGDDHLSDKFKEKFIYVRSNDLLTKNDVDLALKTLNIT